MPQIRQYEAPALGLQPTETGIEATVNAGRGIAHNYDKAASAMSEVASETKQLGSQTRQLGSETAQAGADFAHNIGTSIKMAEQAIEHQEISHGAKAYAELNDRLTQQWNETVKNADPNDTTVAAKFREEVLEPALNEYGKGFLTSGGEKFAQGRVDSIRNHMFEKTSADMSALAAGAISVNVKQTANSLSNTAINDPSAVPHLLDSADSVVGGLVDSSPNLKGAMASKARMELTEKMKESIVKSGAIGAIQKAADPEAEAEKWAKKYPQYVSGDEYKMLAANARQQTRARQIDESYIDRVQEKEATRISDARETQYLQKLYNDDPQQQSQVSTKAIVNDPMLNRASKERMINVVNREMKPETSARTSARSSVEIFRAMRAPDADPAKITQMIYEARAKDPGEAGSITKADMQDLQKQLLDLKTPEGAALAADRNDFLKRYAPTIDPSMGDAASLQFGHHTALGQQKMYEVEKTLSREEAALRKAGKDPHVLYDPTSPEFFGRPANLMKYRASMQDAAEYQAKLGKNIGGPNTTVTGIEVKDAPAFQPPSNWQFSASRGQYRDPDGKLYDASGKPVK